LSSHVGSSQVRLHYVTAVVSCQVMLGQVELSCVMAVTFNP